MLDFEIIDAVRPPITIEHAVIDFHNGERYNIPICCRVEYIVDGFNGVLSGMQRGHIEQGNLDCYVPCRACKSNPDWHAHECECIACHMRGLASWWYLNVMFGGFDDLED